ncbi:TPR end-of-group domain-containing protein [Hymenobacter algoricola]|uniref:Tetratricopeptide repeat protein n=1 Tax=Hymenobacter algoricola TaxID=486267 RepID=A0ABP7N9J8_9BACT
MQKNASILAALLLTGHLLVAQGKAVNLNQRAADAYSAKNYRQSGEFYDQAFRQPQAQLSSAELYNAACSWARAGEATKAFQYLDRATTAGWENVGHVKQDTDLTTLHADKRWQPMLMKLEAAVGQDGGRLQQAPQAAARLHLRLRPGRAREV